MPIEDKVERKKANKLEESINYYIQMQIGLTMGVGIVICEESRLNDNIIEQE